jgi:hypothetical protein
MPQVTDTLETDGVASFVGSWRTLLDTVAVRREAALVAQRTGEALGPLGRAVDAITRELDADRVGERLWKRDVSLWPAADDHARDEIAHRLGWLDVDRTMGGHCQALAGFADEVRSAGFTHAVLCGMGGSSLAAEVLRRSLGVARGYLDLAILDSTDPQAVLGIHAAERSRPHAVPRVVEIRRHTRGAGVPRVLLGPPAAPARRPRGAERRRDHRSRHDARGGRAGAKVPPRVREPVRSRRSLCGADVRGDSCPRRSWATTSRSSSHAPSAC